MVENVYKDKEKLCLNVWYQYSSVLFRLSIWPNFESGTWILILKTRRSNEASYSIGNRCLYLKDPLHWPCPHSVRECLARREAVSRDVTRVQEYAPSSSPCSPSSWSWPRCPSLCYLWWRLFRFGSLSSLTWDNLVKMSARNTRELSFSDLACCWREGPGARGSSSSCPVLISSRRLTWELRPSMYRLKRWHKSYRPVDIYRYFSDPDQRQRDGVRQRNHVLQGRITKPRKSAC